MRFIIQTVLTVRGFGRSGTIAHHDCLMVVNSALYDLMDLSPVHQNDVIFKYADDTHISLFPTFIRTPYHKSNNIFQIGLVVTT